MRFKLIIISVFSLFIMSNNMYGWFIWDLYQVYDDTDRSVLMDSAYKMYEFNALSKSSDGTSSIVKHDVFYDWYRAHLVLSEKTMNREQTLEIGDYLKINYSSLVFKKKVNGIAYSFSSNPLGKLSLTVSRESSPGSRGAEITENDSTLLMGARYENKFNKIDLKLIKFNDLKIGMSFANRHNEKYDSPGSGIFRLSVDKELSPNLYFKVFDSDTSDGDGGQIFEIKYICYDDSNNIIKSIHFHTPASTGDPDDESSYLYLNTGSVDNDHRFADMSSSIVYALPVPLNTKKIYLIVKTGGIEKAYSVSSDNINYYVIDSSILPDNDYCNLIITESGVQYDNSISIDSTSTYDDTVNSTSMSFSVNNILSSEVYEITGNTALGFDWNTKISFPYIGSIKFSGEYGYSIEKRAYYTGEKSINGTAYNFKISYGFDIPAGLFEIGTLQWMIDDNYSAGFSVDSKKDYNSIEFYPESSGSGIPLGKDIDFNYNGIPDYVEGFYAIDSLQPIFIMGDDKNCNGILDKFEFSDKPDYGIDAGQKGGEYYLWFSPILEMEMQLGYYMTKEYSGDKKLERFYYKFSYEKYFKNLIFVGAYNIASYIKKDLWVEDKGLVDGLDNNADGYIDDAVEVESIISNKGGLYSKNFVNRSLLVGKLKRLKGGLGAKFYMGGYYVNNLDSKNNEFKLGNSGMIDFKKSVFDITFYPFFKLTKIQFFSQPYDISKYYQSYLERNYGIIISYPIIEKWNLKFGYINQMYDFNLNVNDTTGDIMLVELFGKPVFNGRAMVSKVGFEKTRSSNDIRGNVDQFNFFVKLYFRM